MILPRIKDSQSNGSSATRLLVIATTVALLTFLQPASANAEDDASQHIAAAEEALARHDFWSASAEYRKAAANSDDSSLAKRATRMAFSYGFNDDALASALRWVALDEDSDEALLYLALLELRDGDIRQSRKSFRKLLQRGEQAADERLISLIPFLSKEDPEDADQLMRLLSKPYKKSHFAHYAAAVLALYAGDSDEALKRSKMSTELEPGWLKPHLLYARALLLANDADGAIDYVARLVGDTPDPDPEARLELAILYLSAERDDDALSQVNQVLLEQPTRADALRLLAIINFRLENLDAAWQDFEDLLATGHYTMDAFYYLARIADFREEYERAIALYSNVIDGSNAVTSQRRVSGILAKQEQFEKAQQHLEEFGQQHPNYAVDMIQSQAQLLISQERFDEALEYFDRVIRYRPASENAKLSKAELLLRMGRLDDAITSYRQIVSQWPDSSIALNALGYTLADRTDKIKEASRLIRKALKLDPDNAAILDSYGWVLYRLGDHEEALTELERAYEQLEDPEVASHIIEVLWKLDREDEAMERLVEAEELWPESELLEHVRELLLPNTDPVP